MQMQFGKSAGAKTERKPTLPAGAAVVAAVEEIEFKDALKGGPYVIFSMKALESKGSVAIAPGYSFKHMVDVGSTRQLGEINYGKADVFEILEKLNGKPFDEGKEEDGANALMANARGYRVAVISTPKRVKSKRKGTEVDVGEISFEKVANTTESIISTRELLDSGKL